MNYICNMCGKLFTELMDNDICGECDKFMKDNYMVQESERLDER